MNKNIEERLPRVVEDRLQEAYGQIRRGEIKIKKQKKTYRSWLGAAAVLLAVILVPSAVYAAVTYFQRNVKEEEGSVTYEFVLNYELVPGEYQVKADYIPEGFMDDEDGDGKYYGEREEQWITIMPVYTTAEIERINSEITVSNINKVEHTELSGMEADVITFQDAGKNLTNTDIFLFNEEEGYVLEIVAGYRVDGKELLKFADSLHVERTGEDNLTWAADSCEPVPAENYWLQMDDSSIYFDKAVNVSGETRSHFFYREMKAGEDLEYTLLFVVDQDRKDDFLLYPTGSNNDLWQTESMTAEEIRGSLEGYIRLAD